MDSKNSARSYSKEDVNEARKCLKLLKKRMSSVEKSLNREETHSAIKDLSHRD
mgnify:CR=1 FL=1